MTRQLTQRTDLEIAVIGMTGRFPGAANIAEFWHNLEQGRESISFFSDEELSAAGADPEEMASPHYVRARGILTGIEYFDAPFFDYLPTEAARMDPQTCIFHECVWEALEQAGYPPGTFDGTVGLFAGAAADFFWQGVQFTAGTDGSVDALTAAVLTDRDYLCSLVSYKLDLKGPAVFVQSACSTSLLAIHLACRALLTGDCDMALAGGAAVTLPQKTGYLFREGMIKAADGHCKAFDASADGTIGGQGVGVVLLKPLEEAEADRDYIYGIIKGSAVNNDGSRRVGFSAPGVNGQAAVIKMALGMAQVEADSIGYIEAHGTGTNLGDPVELEALKLAFDSDRRGFCAVGSVKTNVGHLDTAAGVTGVIKTLLMLRHRLIPANVHFLTPNPRLDILGSPFYVAAGNTPFKPVNGCPCLRAGVSSFGIGGTNAHVILEEAPALPGGGAGKESGACQLMILSAKSETALEKMSRNLTDYLQHRVDVDLADVAYTLQVGRRAFAYRKMAAVSSAAACIDAFSVTHQAETVAAEGADGDIPVIFMFPGQGSQYVNMAREIYDREPEFRRHMDRCFDILNPLMGCDIKEVIYPDHSAALSNASADPQIDQTEVSQPLIFSLEYALARLLMQWGIAPRCMMGHSIGEYVAACLAGVFCLEDALRLVALRGRWMQQIPGGSMAAVELGEAELKDLLTAHKDLSLAAVNSTDSSVVAGPGPAIDTFLNRLAGQGIKYRRLHTSHAFHSPMMEPVLGRFRQEVSQVALSSPRLAYISNVSGTWIDAAEAADPAYWTTHLISPVRFADGLDRLFQYDPAVFVEVGPGKALSTFVRQHGGKQLGHRVVNLVRHPQEEESDHPFLLDKIGWLWLYGVKPDWQALHRGRERRRLPLPTYAFDRQSCRDLDRLIEGGPQKLLSHSLLRKKPDMADWFYLPVWEQSLPLPAPVKEPDAGALWLLFNDRLGWGERIGERLRRQDRRVISVDMGRSFQKKGPSAYELNPSEPADYHKLFREIRQISTDPLHLLHLWNLTGDGEGEPDLKAVEAVQDLGLYSLLHIARAIGTHGPDQHVRLVVAAEGLFRVTGEETLAPWKATLLGPVKVIPLEYANIHSRCVDVVLPDPVGPAAGRLIDALLAEFFVDSPLKCAALRGHFRWQQVWRPLRLTPTSSPNPRLKPRGVYLITGGLGGMGLTLAHDLARQVSARLILVSRSPLPPREARGGQAARVHRLIREMEEMGGQVAVYSADVSDPQRMQQVVTEAVARFGPINGVLHTAGIIDHGGTIQRRGLQSVAAVTAPKVKGLMVLTHLLKEPRPDFWVLFSSLGNPLYGVKFGQVAYNAANEFLDAFAAYRTCQQGSFTTAVNWTDWLEVGMSIRALDRRFAGSQEPVDHGALMKGALTPAQGARVFDRILAHSLSRVAVCTYDLNALLERMHRQRDEDLALYRAPDRDNSAGIRQRRADLTSVYVAPSNDVEKRLTVIWERFFGLDRVGSRDDFFELGGDSLKAVSLLSTTHREMGVKISLAEFFKQPNISQLARYIMERSGRPDAYEPVPKAEAKDYYPLSSAQKRLFILQQLNLESTAYIMVSAVEVEGEPDKDRLAHTFQRLIHRHESFRTSFHIVEGEPVQRIHDPDEIGFAIEYPSPDQAVQSVRPFDLSCPPLIRLGVVSLSPHRCLLIVNIHHIVFDGASMGVLAREFGILYEDPQARLGGQVQYRDFLEWQNQPRQQEKIEAQQAYWLRQFETEAAAVDLPLDFPRPPVQSFAGRSLAFEIGTREKAALKGLESRYEVTLFMVVLSLLNILLSRLGGDPAEDVVVGTAVGGRSHADLRRVIGMFVNTLALRNTPRPGKRFGAFLQEVRQRTLTAFDNQDYPFEDLVEQVSPRRDAGRNPLFDVMFVFQNIEVPPLSSGGLTFKPVEFESRSSIFDIFWQGFEAPGGLRFKIGYCTRLFKEETVQRIAAYFKNLVAVIGDNPEILLRDIDMVPSAEKRQMLDTFNHTDTPLPRGKTVHRLFEDQVARLPHRIAAVDAGGQVSYRCLNEQADLWAALLRDKGVGVGHIVGIKMRRSAALLGGLLAILKTGGAYLPLDPDYPKKRIDYILESSGTETVVTDRWPAHLNGKKADLPGPGQPVTPGDLAYCIYTSGSTGSPKGVMVRHHSLVNFFTAMAQRIDFSAGRSILALTTMCFDIFVLETLLPLSRGMRVVMAHEDQQADPVQLGALIRRNRVEVVQMTPSRVQLMTELTDDLSDLIGVDSLLLGGEALPGRLLDAVKKRFKGKIYNVYGPTETTVWSTLKDLTGVDGSRVTIGSPIANTRIYILDRCRRVQPLGAVGELFIGGDGLASGYLNNPQLTADRFVNVAAKAREGTRSFKNQPLNPKSQILYRTGDLCRFLPDGEIEFLGRLDHQVKIRGFRIELAEIENHLNRHPRIRQSVVVAREDKGNEKYLTAYIVPQTSRTNRTNQTSPAKLRRYLAEILPHYMIPAFFVPLKEIPLTTNGKIDRRALPDPERAGNVQQETQAAPETETEKVIAGLWKEVLKVEEVGLHDNFFDLGGSSLGAVKLNWLFNRAFDLDMPVALMFRNLTVHYLVDYVRQQGQDRQAEQKRKQAEALDRARDTYIDTIMRLSGGSGE